MKNTKIAGILIDPENKKRYVFHKDMFINQILKDGHKTAKVIINREKDKIYLITKKLANVQAFLLASTISEQLNKSKTLKILYPLIWNVHNSISSSLLLLTHGYKLQIMVLSRNIIENISMIAHLAINETDIDKYINNKLESTRTINTLKKIIPVVGQLYGSYSENFVHISTYYRNIDTCNDSLERDEEFDVVLNSFYISTWLLYVISELVAAEYLKIDDMLYWKKVNKNAYAFSFPQSELQEMQMFIKNINEQKT